MIIIIIIIIIIITSLIINNITRMTSVINIQIKITIMIRTN